MTWQSGGGGASYPGVTGDGHTPGGLVLAGNLSVKRFTAVVEEIFGAAGGSIPSGVETGLGTMTGQGLSSVNFPLAVDNKSFTVPIDGTYRHDFSIPITSGATGGDIEVDMMQDGFPVESWIFTVPANTHTVLNGWELDSFTTANVTKYAVLQSSGVAWTMDASPLISIQLKP